MEFSTDSIPSIPYYHIYIYPESYQNNLLMCFAFSVEDQFQKVNDTKQKLSH